MIVEFAHPFLLMAEIERAIRDTIAALIPADDRGPPFATVLQKMYEPRPAPNSVDRLTVGDYASTIQPLQARLRNQRRAAA